MTVVRGILGGIAFGIISQIVGFVIYGVVFMQWTSEAGTVFRPMNTMEWQVGVPLADILSGLTIALAFALLHKGIPGSGLTKGVVFGLILWLITRFAGELFFYVMAPIPFMLVIAGWLHGLIVAPLGGLALAAIYGKSLK